MLALAYKSSIISSSSEPLLYLYVLKEQVSTCTPGSVRCGDIEDLVKTNRLLYSFSHGFESRKRCMKKQLLLLLLIDMC